MPETLSPIRRHLDREVFCGITTKEVIQFGSSLLLPLMLGLFTIVITLHQQTDARAQRLEDREQAREQREQDLLNWALQREQDLNVSRLQRELDQSIADRKREQDYELANETRMMTDRQRLHELAIEERRFQDALLQAYLNEMDSVLTRHNGTLTPDVITASVVRAKTLAVIRQLDAKRNAHLIRFLFESHQLKNKGELSLNLADAELNGIDLSSTRPHHPMHGLYLVGAYLNNASFRNSDLSGSDFSRSHLNGADFTRCYLENVTFNATEMEAVSFNTIAGANIVIHHSNLSHADFSDAFYYDEINDGRARLNILRSKLFRASFRRAELTVTRIEVSNLMYADFTEARLERTFLVGCTLAFASFSKANLQYSHFERCNMSHANLTNALDDGRFSLLYSVSMSGTILPNGSITPIEINRNLVRNGNADCNRPVNESWTIIKGIFLTTPRSEHEPDNCVFSSIAGNPPVPYTSMKQRLVLDRRSWLWLAEKGWLTVLFRYVHHRRSSSQVLIDCLNDRNTPLFYNLGFGRVHVLNDALEQVIWQPLPLPVRTQQIDVRVVLPSPSVDWVDDIEVDMQLYTPL